MILVVAGVRLILPALSMARERDRLFRMLCNKLYRHGGFCYHESVLRNKVPAGKYRDKCGDLWKDQHAPMSYLDPSLYRYFR